MENIINIKNVKKQFGKQIVLNGVNLPVNKGERLIVVGPNGSGKSTLVNILTSIYKPNEGKVTYDGFENYSDFKRVLGVQFQENGLPAGYKTKELIDLLFEMNYDSVKFSNKEKWYKEMFKDWKEELIETFRISAFLNKKVQKLSGGQKQALNIMLAFVSKPEVLILDEITTGLDIRAQERILEFIDEYVRKYNTTLIVVSHIVKEIATLGERVVILDNHKIITDKMFKDIGNTQSEIDKWLKAYFLEGKVK